MQEYIKQWLTAENFKKHCIHSPRLMHFYGIRRMNTGSKEDQYYDHKRLYYRAVLAFVIHWFDDQNTRYNRYRLAPGKSGIKSLPYRAWIVWNYCLDYHESMHCPQCLLPERYLPWGYE